MEQRTKDDFFKAPIFITGAGRSGTSMIAGLFNKAGMWVGECVNASPDNPKGFFENKRLRDGLIKPILSTHGFDRMGRDPVPEKSLDFDSTDLVGLVKEHLDSDGYMYQMPWGFKDGKLLLMWEAFHKRFPAARWILVRRNKDDIVQSCMNTDFMNSGAHGKVTRNKEFWDNWVDRYIQAMENLKNDQSVEWYEVNTDSVVSGDYLHLGQAFEACDLFATDENIRNFVDPLLWKRSKKEKFKCTTNDFGQTRLKLAMGMNSGRGHILNNIRSNITRQLPQVNEHPVNGQRIAIIGGGPSLEDTIDELKECVEDGVKLVALNGTHDWLLDHGFRPSAMIMVDSRESNVRFVQNPVASCKYFIASQCHPSVFDALSNNEVFIWHANNNIGEEQILEDYYFKNFRFIIGGSTVLLRGIWLMRTLGFTKMDVFGFDSCDMNGKHHAYDQPENDGCEMREVTCMGRKFQCSAWQASQYDDFQHFIQVVGDKFELNVHGDGLISHMMKEGSKLFEQESKTA